MKTVVTNILDLLASSDSDTVQEYLSQFSCERMVDGTQVSLNPDIEHFIRSTAIQFAKQKVSVTYTVSNEADGAFLGYFTIAHKPIEIPAAGVSNTFHRKILRYADYDESTDTFTVSAFLLAQFGKNYGIDNGKRITSRKLMGYAQDVLRQVQYLAGGGMTYLDCEAHAELISFYENEGFRLFGERISEGDGKTLSAVHALCLRSIVPDKSRKK